MTAFQRDRTRGASNAGAINAMPTKKLFIDMLTRDIGLVPAIIDLVDNAADGARRLRGQGSYAGLSVRLEIGPRVFKVSDNCGGISVPIARDYAFRFGRDDAAPALAHSIGQFGVGMKRAIFKLGRHFVVESSTRTSSFVVDEDVEKWADDPLWLFSFKSVRENINMPASRQGTSIVVTKLLREVEEKFRLESFRAELAMELKRRLQQSIANGLGVTINGIPVQAEPLKLLGGARLAPAYSRLSFRKPGAKPVYVRLFCGVGTSEKSQAGWHVFCNGRLVLEADKSSTTGWGERRAVSGIEIPGFHNQYNHLRGYAFFDSDDAGLLPWNTTKTGLDTDSPIYRATRPEMIRLMRPVVDFLNQLKIERQGKDEEESGTLERMLDSAKESDIESVTTRKAFVVRIPAAEHRLPADQRIQYFVPRLKAEAAKRQLKVKSWTAVGERTFHYYYANEVEP